MLKMHFKNRLFLMGIFFAFFSLAGSSLRGSEEMGEMTFCHFGPKFKVVFPVVRAESWGGKDLCTGSAKIQGVFWECTQPAHVEGKTSEFQDKLRKQARIECQNHCERRSARCVGELALSSRCGLQTNAEDAIIMGKRVGCRKDCTGQAFAYCSLYNSAFRSEDFDQISKQRPNCFCKKK
jgi:hypothetical protein